MTETAAADQPTAYEVYLSDMGWTPCDIVGRGAVVRRDGTAGAPFVRVRIPNGFVTSVSPGTVRARAHG